jgi:hypothetical protein
VSHSFAVCPYGKSTRIRLGLRTYVRAFKQSSLKSGTQDEFLYNITRQKNILVLVSACQEALSFFLLAVFGWRELGRDCVFD